MVRYGCIAATVGALALSGCGSTVGDRGLSGAGLGAAAGFTVAAIVGGPLLAAAAIGGAAGAIGGAATKSSQVDLGKPWWEQR